MKNIAKNTFYQLLVVYTLFIVLISLSLFWKYTLHFEIFAVILAVLGIAIISKEKLADKPINKKSHYYLLGLAVFLTLLFRIIPYIGNSIPLGYDTGIYKYAIEHGLENQDKWILQGVEPGFLYLMEVFKLIFSTQAILIWVFIAFNLLLGIAIYFFAKEYFNKKTAIIAFLIYSVSVIQFKTFGYMYYKNIIGLSLMLFALYFLERNKRTGKKYNLALFVLFGAALGTIHRPTFYIFGLSYFVYAFVSPWSRLNVCAHPSRGLISGLVPTRPPQSELTKLSAIAPQKFLSDGSRRSYDFRKLGINVICGIAILILAGLFYIGKFSVAVTEILPWVAHSFVSPGESPGTFVSFFTYQFSTLAYLPFAILGFAYLVKKRQFGMLFLWTLINAIIVYFQFFFFNRFIIHLDIALIILAAVGFSVLIEDKKKWGVAFLVLMLFSAGFVTLKDSLNAGPPISESNLELIQKFQNVEKNALVMALSSEYSPWVKGYSERITLAPGMFDEDKWNEAEWRKFWEGSDANETREMMSVYSGDIYLFAGTKNFNNPCFRVYLEKNGGKIYKYEC